MSDKTINKQPRQDKKGSKIRKALRFIAAPGRAFYKKMEGFNPTPSTEADYEGLDERLEDAQADIDTQRFRTQKVKAGILKLPFSGIAQAGKNYIYLKIAGSKVKVPEKECVIDIEEKTVEITVAMAKQLGLV